MKLKIEITMDNAAFDSGADGDPQTEVARILNRLADTIFNGAMGMKAGANCPLRDINGNKVGEARVSK